MIKAWPKNNTTFLRRISHSVSANLPLPNAGCSVIARRLNQSGNGGPFGFEELDASTDRSPFGSLDQLCQCCCAMLIKLEFMKIFGLFARRLLILPEQC